MRCTARATRSQPRRSWASVAPTSTASSMNSTSEGQYHHSRRTTCGSMRSVPPRGSGWVMIVTRACHQRLTHPLPRGGTDLMTRERQPSHPLPRGGTDLMTRERQPSHPLPRGGTDLMTRERQPSHPLPRGGTDLMTRERQPSHPLPRGGTDSMTRERQPSLPRSGTDSSLYNQCVMASLQQRLPENVPGDFLVDST